MHALLANCFMFGYCMIPYKFKGSDVPISDGTAVTSSLSNTHHEATSNQAHAIN